jgi:hypothetical protein
MARVSSWWRIPVDDAEKVLLVVDRLICTHTGTLRSFSGAITTLEDP